MRSAYVLVLLCLLCSTWIFAATTGKISGRVIDTQTGEPLPGANIVVGGTNRGAATDIDGYYVILNIPPGTYSLTAMMVGYAHYNIENVIVKIDLTTTINVPLQQEALQGEEVTITAERPVVVKDISSSQANLSMDDVEALPSVSVTSIVGMQAGARGLSIRGGGIDETAFIVNGITLRDERDNTPYTGISYTAVEEIQIQTGGFNAEYGNVRSGIVNVITREGRPDRYNFSLIARYSPVSQKHFGPSPHDANSYWVRPFIDNDVAWTGTKNGEWNDYMQRQFVEFEGWNSVSARSLQDDDPNNDLTPAAAQRLFLWEHRRQLDIDVPDYNADASFGGPVPFLSKPLGGLRFFASYRTAYNAYVVPLSTKGYVDTNVQLKVTSDISDNMKLMIDGLIGEQSGTNSNNSGLPGLYQSASSIASSMSKVSYIDTRLFTTDYWAPSKIKRNNLAARFTHVLGPTTFYEASLQRFESKYDTNPGRSRDTSRVYLFGNNYYRDEAPLGFYGYPAPSISGMAMGVGMSNSRDSSNVVVYTGRFDMTSQLGRFNHVKTGVEFVYTDNNVNYASVDVYLKSGRSQSKWHTFPVRTSFYFQDRLEFEGMIANLGVRVDYSDPNGNWYVYDTYDQAFAAENAADRDSLLVTARAEQNLTVSPRLGIAFPISINSKIFFNYGHFRQMPRPDDLYLFREFSDNKAVSRVADPNNPLEKTVAYELGYEQNLYDQFLLRVMGYYRDIALQPRLVRYTSRDNKVNYTRSEPNNYRDIRGFEVELNKNRGRWVQGFLNYTYQVETAGNFGYARYYENPADQRSYERETRSHYQEKPVPRPYARANIYLFTPHEWGPEILGMQLLSDWRLNTLANWRSGFWFTWTGGGAIPGIVYNAQWNTYFNLDLRLSKVFRFEKFNFEFFMDIYNATNYKYMTYSGGFINGEDYDDYMKSLHLPDEIGDPLGYGNIPGNDRPGDYRTVPYEPYDPNDTDQARKERILETKAYIDMPNQEFFTFLNPRDIFFGIKLNFEID